MTKPPATVMPAPIEYTLTADAIEDALNSLRDLQNDLHFRAVYTVNTALLITKIRQNLQKLAECNELL
jgi:hypothetical protein